ncbi:DUF4242 domain-containing protein [Aquimarina sp. AU474]|uniref:DUF4242 domain-containing protein n=1 Tax=Aquimarina sp. AU474 TaxID=2108529 RepID=UPI000D689C25|nr:DUF4242 domain-containing protein [Aquimarina sp. AU474]
MKTYLIERTIPEIGNSSKEQLKQISQKSCKAVGEIGSNIHWLHSYIVKNKVYCVYKAMNKKLIKEHAVKGGFPIDVIYELKETISPEISS